MPPATLDDTARAISRARMLELRCFEILGRWVTTTPEPEVKLLFARQSHHHAWHAELFERVRPTASGFATADDEADGPGGGFLSAVEELVPTASRVTGAYEVLLPAKLAEYEAWLDVADPVRDAPLRRWLGFVVADERADLAESRDLLVRYADQGSTRTTLEAALRAAAPLLGGFAGRG